MKYLFTKKGFEELKELIRQTEERLKEIRKRKAEAGTGQNGWHDEQFRLSEAEENRLIDRLENLMKLYSNAEVIEPEEQCECVKIGVGIVIKFEDGTTDKIILDGYQVVLRDHIVSIYSPIGNALLGAKKGEIIEIKEIKRQIEVIEIYPPSKAFEMIESEKEKNNNY